MRTLQAAAATFACALGAATVQFGRPGLSAVLAVGAAFGLLVTSRSAAVERGPASPPGAEQTRRAHLEALRRERDGYVQRGDSERAAQVDAEIARVERRPTDGAT